MIVDRGEPLAFGGVFGSGDCPPTGLIFTKPQNSSEAARVALPQTAVAIVLQRFRSAYWRLALLDSDGRAQFANRAMATALNGRARLIPLVQRLSFGSRLTCGGQSPLPSCSSIWRLEFCVRRVRYKRRLSC